MPHGGPSDISAGPGRTQRAIDNYRKAPNSYGAKLFAARMRAVNETARQIGWLEPCAFKTSDGRVQFYACSVECITFQACIGYSYVLSPYDREEEKREATVIDMDLLTKIVLGEKVRDHYGVIEQCNPGRTSRCQTCGASINPDGHVSLNATAPLPNSDKFAAPPEPEMPKLEQLMQTPSVFEQPYQSVADSHDEVVFVDDYGRAVNIDLIRAVVLTTREAELFNHTDYTARAQFASKHGMTVQQYFG